MMNSINRRVMVVAPPRSGTTLVQSILSNHPHMFTVPETHYFEFMLRRDYRRFIDLVRIGGKRFRNFRRYIEEHNILRLPEGIDPPSTTRQVVKYFLNMMDRCAILDEKPAWVEKTPGHLFYVDQIEKYCNSIIFLHIFRKPEEVVASLVKVGRKYAEKWPGYASLDKSIDVVESSYSKMSDNIIKNNHVPVIFEHLLSNPEEILDEILDKTGMESNKQIIAEMLSSLSATSLSREGEVWKEGYGDSVIRGRASGFETLFDNKEKAYIRARLGVSDKLYRQVAEKSLR